MLLSIDTIMHVRGSFDPLVDGGVYNDLSLANRRAYLRNVVPLKHTKSRFPIYLHRWPPRWW